MIPNPKKIREQVKKMNIKNPIVIISPVNRYLGFSAPVSPVQQFSEVAEKWGVPIKFLDPIRTIIKLDSNQQPQIFDDEGEVKGSAYFPFGHTELDRNMTKLIIKALEKKGDKVVNGYMALTESDDKALTAINFANSNLNVATSIITSARANTEIISEQMPKDGQDHYVVKTSGFTAGGVGTQPIPKDVDFLAPLLWASRKDSLPKIVQNDIDASDHGLRRKVIRVYIVGGEVVGAYFTEGEGIVNCAGLSRESKAQDYELNIGDQTILCNAADRIGASGFCRIDAAINDKGINIFEINPLARIDAQDYGLDIPAEILWYAIKLSTSNK